MKSRIKVRIGSLNDAKIEAVRRGLRAFYEDVEVAATRIPSGVSEQPIGFSEILAGARARARGSFAVGDCELAAGIEDGLVPVEGVPTGHVNIGCCVLFDGREESYGLSAGFEYPQICVDSATAEERVPIGRAFDAVFEAPPGWHDPGSGAGNIGRLTGGVLTRVEYGAQAVICALVRRLHPALYGRGSA